MNIAMEELLQMLGAKDVEIYLLRKQIAELLTPKEAEKPLGHPNN